jgi:hypothetical protein
MPGKSPARIYLYAEVGEIPTRLAACTTDTVTLSTCCVFSIANSINQNSRELFNIQNTNKYAYSSIYPASNLLLTIAIEPEQFGKIPLLFREIL